MLSFEWNFLGLSNEVKPTTGEKVIDGSTFYECDTCKFFIFYKGTWYEQIFVTEDGINVYVYKYFMRKLFKRSFDTNISKLHIYKPEISSNIEVTTDYPAVISDASLYGDTTQQTYSGKSLVNFATSSYLPANRGNATRDGATYTVTGNSNDKWGGIYFPSTVLQLKTSTTYTFSAKVQSTTNPDGSKVFVTRWATDSGVAKEGNLAKAGERSVVTFTTPSAFADNPDARLLPYAPDTSAVFTDIMLEESSTATAYEPYVGGIPSPNPDYPQTVNIVTGEQTITINEDELAIDLGNLELCKIGDYQDYIYKNGDDWYVHKETTKILGSQATWGNNGTNENYTQGVITVTDVSPSISLSDFCDMYCANLLASGDAAKTQTVSPTTAYRCGGTTSSGYIRVNIGVSYAPDWTSFTNIIQNLVLYYALATPTDTKITDTTLLTGLNNLLGYNLPEGTITITVTSDNLPAKLGLIITERE